MNGLIRNATIILLAAVMVIPAAVAGAAERRDAVLDNLPLNELRTYAGTGELGESDGSRQTAEFRLPASVAVDADGRLIVADTGNQMIRTIAGGEVATAAGMLIGFNNFGYPSAGYADGPAGEAAFDAPSGIAVDRRGRIIVADAGNHAIRAISPEGKVTTVAGTGILGLTDGAASQAAFYNPLDVAVSPSGVIYVADTLNHVIRKIENGRVTTLNAPSERAVEIFPGVVEATGDFRDGALSEALFNEPSGLAIDAKGNLYVADTGNQRIRYIDLKAGTVTTVAGGGELLKDAAYVEGDFVDGKAGNARFNAPRGIDVTPDGGLLIADSLNHVIRYLKDGVVTTVAGVPGETGKWDGVSRSANLSLPTDVAYIGEGAFVIADKGNNRIRIVRPYDVPAGLEGSAIEIVHNRNVLESDVEPIAVSGTTFVPVRVISEALGYTVDFGANGVTTLKQGDAWYRIREGSRTVESSSGNVQLPQAPFYRDNRLFLPVRFFAEELDLDVQWLSGVRAVLIRDKLTDLQY
jgi:sugar lactone lactonase YvrE